MDDDRDLDADEVSLGLFVGAVPPPDVGARGFHGLVLAAEEHQPPAERFRGVIVVHAPLDDDSSRPMTRVEQLTALAAAGRVATMLAARQQVLVTCHMGLNRSSLIAALAMRRHLGVDAAAAIKAIRAARGRLALCNHVFVEMIVGYRAPTRRRPRITG